MNDPKRYLDDSAAPAEILELLRAAPAPPPINPAFKAQAAAELAKITATGASGMVATIHAKLVVIGTTVATVTAITVANYTMLPSSPDAVSTVEERSTAPQASVHVSSAPVLDHGSEDATPQPSRAENGPQEVVAIAPSGQPSVESPPTDSTDVSSQAQAPRDPPTPPSRAARAGSIAGRVTALPVNTAGSDTAASGTMPSRTGTLSQSDALSRAEGSMDPRAEQAAPTLTDEARSLERARRLLGTSPNSALRAVDAHRSQFPGGQLGAESELIAISALVRLGRSAEASRRGNQFLGRHPRGIYADRVRRLLGSE